MKSLTHLGCAFAIAAVASSAHANMLVNGSLESGVTPTQPDNLVYVTPSTNTNALTGWTLVSGAIDIVPSSYFQNTKGSYSVDMAGTPGVGSIAQQVATVASNIYTMTFDFSVNPQKGPISETGLVKTLRVEALGADGITVLATQDFTGVKGTRTASNMQWSQKTFNFVADGGFSTIRFSAIAPNSLPGGLTAGTLYTGPVIDNVVLEIAGGGNIPEPASLSTLGIAGLLLLKRRRKA